MQAGRGQAARRQEEEERRAEITSEYFREKIVFVLSVLYLSSCDSETLSLLYSLDIYI